MLSPVTTQFSNRDNEKLVSLTKHLKTVYICNDNEASGAGEKGALKTAKLLRHTGVDVRIVKLPRTDGVDKIDVAEYFLSHTKDDFDAALHYAEKYFTYMLKKCEIPDGKTDRIEVAKQFVSDCLCGLKRTDAEPIINGDLKTYFGITRDDSRILLAHYKEAKNEINTQDLDTEDENKTRIIQPQFDLVAQKVMDTHHMFVYADTKDFWIYNNGVYQTTGAENYVKKQARLTYVEMYKKRYIDVGEEPPEYIQEPVIGYTAEVLEKIRIDKSIPRSVVEKIDQKNRHLINLKNGVFNLMTWKLEPHNPELMMLRQIDVEYNPQADCPNFKKFLSEIVSPYDADVIVEFLGYYLIPDVRFQRALMFYGEGYNGKSILLKFVNNFWGKENTAAVSLQDLDGDNYAAAELANKLINVYPDLGSQMIESDNKFKALVAGDQITARHIYGHPFKFTNFARLLFSANNVPPAHSGKFAYYRRWKLIPFPYKFINKPKPNTNERKKDAHIEDRINTPEEYSGALNLFLYGLANLLTNGAYSYDCDENEIEHEYTKLSDPIKSFVEQHLEWKEGYAISKTKMYDEYCAFCKLNNIKQTTQRQIANRLKKLGIEETRPYGLDGSRSRQWDDVTFKKMPSQANTVDNYLDAQNEDTELKNYLGLNFACVPLLPECLRSGTKRFFDRREYPSEASVPLLSHCYFQEKNLAPLAEKNLESTARGAKNSQGDQHIGRSGTEQKNLHDIYGKNDVPLAGGRSGTENEKSDNIHDKKSVPQKKEVVPQKKVGDVKDKELVPQQHQSKCWSPAMESRW